MIKLHIFTIFMFKRDIRLFPSMSIQILVYFYAPDRSLARMKCDYAIANVSDFWRCRQTIAWTDNLTNNRLTETIDRSKRTNQLLRVLQPITWQFDWPIRSITRDKYHPLTAQYHNDSEDDYRSGCRNVSHCHQQFFSELHSPGRSH